MLIGLTCALPPSMRASTDEEVAEFLRALLPDRLEKRKIAIKGALEAADRREAGKSAPRITDSDAPPDEAPTVLEGLVSNREVTPSAEGRLSLPGATTREGAPSARDTRRPPPRRTLRTVLSIAAIAGAGAIIALLLSRRAPPPVAASPAPTAIVTVTREVTPPASDAPVVNPVEPLPPAPPSSVAPVKSAAPLVVRRFPRTAPAVSAKPAHSGTPTFVSPIRNPGF